MNIKTMRVMGFAAVACAIVLSACSGAATPAPQPTAAPKATDAPKPAATAVPATKAPAAPAQATAAPAPAGDVGALKIDAAQSSASFTLGETLLGQPKTVVGKTSKVTGDITLNLANPAQSKVGVISVDATDFVTDNRERNGAIQRFILQTNQAGNQFVTFEPTAIDGLPASVKAGDTVNFKITGNLKIHGVTKPVTFDTTAIVKSGGELSGTAKTKIMRTAFGLNIPSVREVADVTDEVALQLDFVAK